MKAGGETAETFSSQKFPCIYGTGSDLQNDSKTAQVLKKIAQFRKHMTYIIHALILSSLTTIVHYESDSAFSHIRAVTEECNAHL